MPWLLHCQTCGWRQLLYDSQIANEVFSEVNSVDLLLKLTSFLLTYYLKFFLLNNSNKVLLLITFKLECRVKTLPKSLISGKAGLLIRTLWTTNRLSKSMSLSLRSTTSGRKPLSRSLISFNAKDLSIKRVLVNTDWTKWKRHQASHHQARLPRKNISHPLLSSWISMYKSHLSHFLLFH